MSEEIFKGNSIYSINCSGDACVGDEVCFSRAIFGGSYRKPKFLGYELVEARIVKDSYGVKKQQHTFTLQRADGSKIRIKGRNLYRNGCYRKPWENEAERKEALDEKHSRGELARAAREERKFGDEYVLYL